VECARRIHTPLFMLHQRSHIDDKPFSPTLPPAMPPDSASPIEAFLRGTELFFKQSSDEIGKAIEKVLSPEKKEPDSERVDTPRSCRFEAIDEPDIDVVDRSTKAEQRNIMPATAFTQLERRERQEVAARAMDLEMKALRESLSPTVVARATADEVEVESLSLAGSTEAEAQALVTKAIAEAMAEAVVAEVASNAVAAQESQARAIAFQGAIKAMEPGRKQQLLDSTDEFSSEAASSAEKRTVRLAATEVTAATEAAAATKEAAPPEEKATASQTPSTLCPSPDRRSLLELIQRSAERSARHDPYYDVAAQLSRYHPSAAAEAAAEAAELTLAQKREKEEAMAGKRRHLSTGEVVSIKTEKEAILDALLQRKREEAEVRGIVIETASTNEVTHGLLRAGLSGLLQAKLTAQQEFDLKKAQKRAEEEARTAADANYPSPQGDSAEAFREEPRLDASSLSLLGRHLTNFDWMTMHPRIRSTPSTTLVRCSLGLWKLARRRRIQLGSKMQPCTWRFVKMQPCNWRFVKMQPCNWRFVKMQPCNWRKTRRRCHHRRTLAYRWTCARMRSRRGWPMPNRTCARMRSRRGWPMPKPFYSRRRARVPASAAC